MPIPKREAIPEGIIADVHRLMGVTSAMSPVGSTFFARRAPHLASNRPRATAAEMASAAERARSSRGDFEEERAVAILVKTIRRREHERLEWLLANDLVAGDALAWAISHSITERKTLLDSGRFPSMPRIGTTSGPQTTISTSPRSSPNSFAGSPMPASPRSTASGCSEVTRSTGATRLRMGPRPQSTTSEHLRSCTAC